jgi:hypothetical protein
MLKADTSGDNELATYLRLEGPIANYPGSRHVLELLDYFGNNGPNGTHLCLVLPVMASNGKDMTVTGRHPMYELFLSSYYRVLTSSIPSVSFIAVGHPPGQVR